MGKNSDAFKQSIKDLRNWRTGCMIFTEDDGTGEPSIELSKTWKQAKAGQVVGAVQLDADRIYVSGRKFTDNRMKALRKGIRDNVPGRFWVMSLQEAQEQGYAVDPGVLADDNPDFDDVGPQPQEPATSSTHFDEVIPTGPLPMPEVDDDDNGPPTDKRKVGSPDKARPAVRAASPEYGDVSDARNPYADVSDVQNPYGDVSDVRAAASADAAVQDVLGKNVAAYGKMLAAWPALYNRLFSSGGNDTVKRDMMAVDGILRPRGAVCLTLDEVRQRYGATAAQVMDDALRKFMGLAKWSQDNPIMTGDEVASLRAVTARVIQILPKLRALLDKVALTDPDAATQADMDRLEGLAFKGGRALTANDIYMGAGNKGAAVLGEVEELFVKLAKIALAATSLSDAAASGGEYAVLPQGNDAAPSASALPDDQRRAMAAQKLQTAWEQQVAPMLPLIVSTRKAEKAAVDAQTAEFFGLLQGDLAALGRAKAIVVYFLQMAKAAEAAVKESR